jgi:hypothetical protein
MFLKCIRIKERTWVVEFGTEIMYVCVYVTDREHLDFIKALGIRQ